MNRSEYLQHRESFYDPDYISIDTDAISYNEFEDYFQHHGNERCWRVIYNRQILTEHTEIKGQIGTLYVRIDGYGFEDNLQVERYGGWQASVAQYQSSRNFIPFALQPWLYTRISENNPDMVITPRMERLVKFHYNECNKHSISAQKELNYDENLHRKFAAMDNIINGLIAESGMNGSPVPLWPFHLDNDLADATEILANKGLIRPGGNQASVNRVVNQSYVITPLGETTERYGLKEALKFKKERDRENELLEIGQKTIEAQESIKKFTQNMDITSKNSGKYATPSFVISVIMLFLTILVFWQQCSQKSTKSLDDANEMSGREVYEFMEYKQETEQMHRFLPSLR